MGAYLASIDNHDEMDCVYSYLSVLLEKLCYCRPELFMGPLCVIAKFHYTGPTGPDRTKSVDFVGDPGLLLSLLLFIIDNHYI